MKTQRFLLFSALVALIGLSVACSSGSQPESESSTDAPETGLANECYLKMTGTIGDIPITMDLFRNDTTLSGTYYYNKIGMPLYLDGKIKEDGTFTLSEHNSLWDETGRFSGTLTPEGLKGTWSTPDQKKSLPANLNAGTDLVAGLEMEERSSKNCKNADANRKNGIAENYWDTICTTMDLSMMRVKLEDAGRTQQVNTLLEKSICAMAGKYSNLDALMKSVDEADGEYGFERDAFCGLMTNDKDVLCIRLNMYEYSFGAAHPNGYSSFINIDINTGKEITINDILKSGSEGKLNIIGEKKFVAAYGSDGWDFEPGSFSLSKDVAIMPGGLLYQFDSYEIGPYAAGAPEVFIPYSEIKDLLVPGSPVQVFVK